jgi:competence protein ComFB
LEGITNYNESLVMSCIHQKLRGKPFARDDEYIADIACIALNRLPARYVRHIVDTRFFESEADIIENNRAVNAAVEFAIRFIDERQGLTPDGSATKTLRA